MCAPFDSGPEVTALSVAPNQKGSGFRGAESGQIGRLRQPNRRLSLSPHSCPGRAMFCPALEPSRRAGHWTNARQCSPGEVETTKVGGGAAWPPVRWEATNEAVWFQTLLGAMPAPCMAAHRFWCWGPWRSPPRRRWRRPRRAEKPPPTQAAAACHGEADPATLRWRPTQARTTPARRRRAPTAYRTRRTPATWWSSGCVSR